MTYKIRFHPKVADDLQIIAEIVADYSGFSVAKKKLEEIGSAVFSLADTPKKGSNRSELGVVVRAIPAGRKGVVIFEFLGTYHRGSRVWVGVLLLHFRDHGNFSVNPTDIPYNAQIYVGDQLGLDGGVPYEVSRDTVLHRIVGINPNRPKYPISTERVSEDRGFKMPAENVVMYLQSTGA